MSISALRPTVGLWRRRTMAIRSRYRPQQDRMWVTSPDDSLVGSPTITRLYQERDRTVWLALPRQTVRPRPRNRGREHFEGPRESSGPIDRAIDFSSLSLRAPITTSCSSSSRSRSREMSANTGPMKCAPNRTRWAHSLSELEQGYIDAMTDPAVPAPLRMRAPVDPGGLTSEEAGAARRLFGTGADRGTPLCELREPPPHP